ncbi:MAG: bifunctional enoyl-CoA hydratase/phosphate acetyltransferase [Anaerolineae bacterium]
MRICNFQQLMEIARGRGPQRVAVAAAEQPQTLIALARAHREGLAIPILVGDEEAVRRVAAAEGLSLEGMEVVHQPLPRLAAKEAVRLVTEGLADLVMNGRAQPGDLLRAALAREGGLRMGRLLTDVAVFEIPGFDRLILVSDIGVVISPTLEEKVGIVQNAIDAARALGVEQPRVALLSATEMVNPKIPTSLDASNLAKMADRGQIKGGIVDGPLALDNAISPQSAAIKGIRGPVAGQADILIAPDIETGNLLAKAITCFAGGKMASVVVGARCPLVMPSRADPPESKLTSLALARVIQGV